MTGFGLGYLKGPLVGTCNALIGDASTGKSALAEQFLAAEFEELIVDFIRVYARFHPNRNRDPKQIRKLDQSWLWVLDQIANDVFRKSQIPGSRRSSSIQRRSLGDRDAAKIKKALQIGVESSVKMLRRALAA